MIEPENKSLYVEGADASRTSAISTSNPPAPSYMREQGGDFFWRLLAHVWKLCSLSLRL